MSRLIYNADVFFRNAQDNYNIAAKDALRAESYLSIACFEAHQAIEMYLKGLVELNGEEYAENHYLEDNLAKLPELQQELPEVYDLISKNYSKYNQWEQKGRYNINFKVVIDDLKDAVNTCCVELHYYCKKKIEGN